MFRVATTMLSASAARMSSRASRCVTVATPRFFSASIISGTKIAQTVVTEVAEAVSTHAAECGRAPGLATVLVGARPDSQRYIAMKKKRATECGFASFHKELDADTSQEELLDVVRELNADPAVDGILVQLPLPDHIDQGDILEAIDIDKDVDGFHPTNMGKLARSGEDLKQHGLEFDAASTSNAACTPLGCIELLTRSGVDLSKAHAVVLGRSNIVGLPVALMLLHCNATVTVCHSRTHNIEEICSQADVVIAALGQAEMVRGDWIKPGAVVIDVGINFVDDDTRKTGRRLCGDVKFDEVAAKASQITPVPGGVGPMTVAMLMRNTLVNWKRRCGLMK